MEDKEENWPAAGAAYDFVLPSYQWMLTRIEAADSRLLALQLFVLTVTTGAPTLAKAISPTLQLMSPLLAGAMLFAVASIAVGIWGRAATRITLMDPCLLYSKTFLRIPEWGFKLEMLRFAAKHFDKNAALVVRKHRLLSWMTGLFLAELILLAFWFWLAGA